jgi:uncharacterized protein (TIGR02611 family)
VDHIIRHTKRTLIAILGGCVVLIGVILIPYPGPGWLIVFSGLAILATEFHFARRLLENLRGRYERYSITFKQQHGVIKAGALLVTGLVVVATVWLVNGFGITSSVLQLDIDWLTSPLMR